VDLFSIVAVYCVNTSTVVVYVLLAILPRCGCRLLRHCLQCFIVDCKVSYCYRETFVINLQLIIVFTRT